MTEKRTLILPRANGATESIETTQSLLFIAANGSGKTRLGTWIEIQSPQRKEVHRISAQKSLSMPDSTTPIAIDLAEKSLLFGNPGWTYEQKNNKWGGKPATALLLGIDVANGSCGLGLSDACPQPQTERDAATLRGQTSDKPPGRKPR